MSVCPHPVIPNGSEFFIHCRKAVPLEVIIVPYFLYRYCSQFRHCGYEHSSHGGNDNAESETVFANTCLKIIGFLD